MKRVLLAFLLSVIVLFSCIECAVAGSLAGNLTFVQGDVRIKHDSIENGIIARAGESIAVGDLLEAGTDSRTQVLLMDGSVINLSSGARLGVMHYLFDPTTNRRTALIKVLSGMVRFIVRQRHPESAFKVESINSGVTLREADVVVIAERADTTFAVLDGRVTVRNTWKLAVGSVSLSRNEATIVKKNSPPSIPVVITTQQRRMYSKDADRF